MVTKNKTRIKEQPLFLGRQALVSKIYARIGACRPQSVSIVGDIKIGKTSLLKYLADEDTKKKMLKKPGDYLYIFIPCRRDEPLTLESFTSSIYKIALKYAGSVAEEEHQTFKYNYFKRLVETLHKQDKKIILFLDDFNLITLNPAFPLEFFSYLRSLANNYNLAYVTTSYEDLQKLCVSKDIEESPFFNIFTNMSLRGFEAAEIDTFIEHSGNNGDGGLINEMNYITGLVGSSPYTLNIACQHLSEFKSIHGELNDGLKTQFEDLLKKKLQDYFQHLWEYMDKTHHYILAMIVSGKKIPGAHDYILRDLAKKNYVSSDNGKTKITFSLLEQFVRQTTGITQSERNFYGKLSAWFRQLKKLFLGKKKDESFDSAGTDLYRSAQDENLY